MQSKLIRFGRKFVASSVAVVTLASTMSIVGSIAASEVVSATGGPASCTLYFTGAASSTWESASNWSATDGGSTAGRIPNSSDTVCFSSSPSTSDVTLSSSATVAGIHFSSTHSVTPHLTINWNGSLNVTSDATAAISNLTDNATVTVGSGTTLSIDTLATANVPVFVGPGSVVINNGGTANLAGNSPTLRGGVTFVNNGTTTLPSATAIFLSNRSIFKNNGTFTVGAGSDLCDVDRSGSYFWNTTSGVFDVNGANATVHVPTTNNGTLNVLSGNITLFQGVLNTGTFNIGDHLVTIAGTYTASSAAAVNVSFDAAGTGLLAAGTGAHLAGTTTVTVAPSFSFSGANVIVNAVTASGASNTSSVVVTGAAHYSTSNTTTGTKVTVCAVGPAITSSSTTVFVLGESSRFDVTFTGFPTPSFSFTGSLPDGISYDASHHEFSGTATENGQFTLNFSASNGKGTATQTFTILCESRLSFTPGTDVRFNRGEHNSFFVATNDDTNRTFSHSGTLPSGVSFDDHSGELHGTPDAGTNGHYHVHVNATNDLGTIGEDIDLWVNDRVTGCTLYFTGAASSTWESASNWSATDGGSTAGRIPNSSDTVCFSSSPSTSDVTLSSSATVAGIHFSSTHSVTPHLTINWNGSLNVTSDATAAISNLTDNATVTVGSGTTLSIDTLATANVPVFVGPGSVVINNGGTANLAGNSPTLRGGVTFVNNGTTTLPSATAIFLSNRSIFKNNGTFTVGAGSDLCDVDRSGSYFWNTTSGVFDVNGANATVHVPTTNNGTLNVLSGNITLFQGVLNTGTFNIGDHLVTIAGTYTASSAAAVNVSFDAAGTGLLAAGTGAHLAGTTTVTVAPSFSFSGANVIVNAVTASGASNTSSVVVTGAAHYSTSNTTTGTKVTISTH